MEKDFKLTEEFMRQVAKSNKKFKKGESVEQVKMVIEKLDDKAIMPEYAHDDDSCFDISCASDISIKPGKTVCIPSYLAIEIPEVPKGLEKFGFQYEIMVRARSGVSLKKTVILANGVGTIDKGYEGDVGVIMHNYGKDIVEFKRGDRIAQAALCVVVKPMLVEGTFKRKSERGDGGYGSTGE